MYVFIFNMYKYVYTYKTTLYISLKEYVFSANAKTVKSEEFAKKTKYGCSLWRTCTAGIS